MEIHWGYACIDFSLDEIYGAWFENYSTSNETWFPCYLYIVYHKLDIFRNKQPFLSSSQTIFFFHLMNIFEIPALKNIYFSYLCLRYAMGVFCSIWIRPAYLSIKKNNSYQMQSSVFIIFETNNWYIRKYVFILFITSKS